ncbi:unnamed protein product [Pedinophyceae sp. YPF-701]|nr:unnamed protein product [Pedinophyceae sp. YPF-701]
MPSRLPCSRLKLDELFVHWLLLPDSQKFAFKLIDDAKEGKPLHSVALATPGANGVALSPTSSATMYPPLSPGKSASPGPFVPSPLRKLSQSRSSGSKRESDKEQEIPQFYFPRGKPPPEDQLQVVLAKKKELFAAAKGPGLNLEGFVTMVQDVLEMPTSVAYVLFDRLAPMEKDTVSEAEFDAWCAGCDALTVSRVHRLWTILRGPENDYLQYDDFVPVVRAVINTHPGLEFLKDTPEFQDRYQETVIYRILYTVNRSDTGRITLKELHRSDLLEALTRVDEEEDINKVLRYFSYEHFYVIYCKFWELDSDHDFMIDKDALLRYGNHSLTYRIVDRIFDQVPRKFRCQTPGRMGYEDFVWFILSEEDKTTDMALAYWFRCVDLHGDNLITQDEAAFFYEEQVHRMENLMHEPVLFEDIVCQLTDMVKPERDGLFTLRDLKRSRQHAGVLFNCLFNINKFIAFENRDPFLARQQEQEAPQLSQWDRFAAAEYLQLAMDEEGEDAEDAGLSETLEVAAGL